MDSQILLPGYSEWVMREPWEMFDSAADEAPESARISRTQETVLRSDLFTLVPSPLHSICVLFKFRSPFTPLATPSSLDLSPRASSKICTSEHR